jgi:type II secretory pathway pseudopilin PulG
VVKRGKRRGEAGLTLVELMITLIIASLVTTATFAFFSGQQRIYETQSKMLTTQQTLWSAIDVVSRSLRTAGGGMFGCVRADSDGAGADTGDPPPGGAAAPATGLRVYRSGVGVFRLAPYWFQNGAAGAPDTLTIAYGSGSTGSWADAVLGADFNPATPTTPVRTLAGQTVRFFTGEFIMLVDRTQANGDRGCSLFQITGIDALNNNLLHVSATSEWNPPNNVPDLVPFTYPGGTTASSGGIRDFGTLTWVQFAVDRTGTIPPRLTMNRLDGNRGPEILADGIEDLQISYACDIQPAGAPDGVLTEGTDPASRLADEWVYNQALDPVPIGCNKPDAIRITLMARSLTPDTLLNSVTDNRKPAAEDGALGPVDTFRHRVATVSVYPRN